MSDWRWRSILRDVITETKACPVCGAYVAKVDQPRHRAWHEDGEALAYAETAGG